MEALVSLLAELNDLKRQSTPSISSLAGEVFASAWRRLLAGEEPSEVALDLASRAVAAARLGGIDEEALFQAGFNPAQVSAILLRSFNSVSEPLDPELCIRLQASLAKRTEPTDQDLLPFIEHLMDQPRAGVTRPGKARIMLLPTESHADHCACVAIYSVLLAPRYGADFVKPFLAALIHHAHNAWLPDAGFTGEEMLGDSLVSVIETLRLRAFVLLPGKLRIAMEAALAETVNADTPEGKTFHASDVLDRVLQMRWYEQAAGFTLKVAMEDMELVHGGPVQEFHYELLREAGLW